MKSKILQYKAMLSASSLFDGDHVARAVMSDDANGTVSTEIRYLSAPSLWTMGTSGLFNGGYYQYRQPDLGSLGHPSIIHYMTNGFAEGRRPSALVDIDYIVSQIVGEALPEDVASRHGAKLEVLSGYANLEDLLRSSGANPNMLFDNRYFLETNGLESAEVDIPVNFYYQQRAMLPGGEGPMETTPLLSMREYFLKNPDVVGADVNALEHLLTFGLREMRLNCMDGLFSEEFLQNTATLYSDPSFKDHEFFIADSMRTGRLAGPAWKSSARHEPNEALAYDSSRVRGSRVAVGTVLYQNSEAELVRLKSSIDREREYGGDVEIDDAYFVNCEGSMDMYRDILGAASVQRSTDGNIGFGSGHNRLMSELFQDHDFYFGLNPDAYLVGDCVASLVSFSRFFGDTAMIEANTMPVAHPKWHDPVMFDTQWVSGVAFFVPRRIWEDVGGFDEEIHMYCEDVDFSWRVKAAGYALKVCPTASIFHDITARFTSAGDEKKSDQRRKAMLLGAHHLSLKWHADAQAADYMKALVGEGLLLPNQKVEAPVSRMPESISEEVADFGHGLRFAPSRFW